MNRRLVSLCLLALTGITASLCAILTYGHGSQHQVSVALPVLQINRTPRGWLYQTGAKSPLERKALRQPAHGCLPRQGCISAAFFPVTFEPNVGQFEPAIEFLGRGASMTVALTKWGMELAIGSDLDGEAANGTARGRSLAIQFEWGARRGSQRNRELKAESHKAGRGNAPLTWQGEQRVRTVSNYFVGRDPRKWHTDVPHFERAAGRFGRRGVDVSVYGNEKGVEYDLSIPPTADVSKLRLRISGARREELLAGDLLFFVGDRTVRMAQPAVYEEMPDGLRKAVRASYVVRADGTVGFRVAHHDPRGRLVIDPSISVVYATFLGGAGSETSGNEALDASGNVYVAGVTTSSSTFPEASASRVGPVLGASAFYVAKINPAAAGSNSLVYVTFLGGSGTQAGGVIAVDSSGDVAITGTTTSPDFPVTASSQPTSGLTSGDGNDVVLSEINPTGNGLVFSTYFGGSGGESVGGAGGIAMDQTGDVYISSNTQPSAVDPSSPDLPVTPGAFQPNWDGMNSDGFLAIFEPPASASEPPNLIYCTYLGTNSEGTVGVGGVAVDSDGDAYVGGTTSNASNGFPVANAFQANYGGGTSDGFVMKIAPLGQGTGDLVYATFIGGSGIDEITAIAVDSGIAPKAYVTGETQSPDFPVNGANAPFQNALRANPHESGSANAFLAVISQNSTSAATSLSYSSYLGGSLTDSGLSIAVAAPNSVYVGGRTDSPDFPWHDNLQPFNGTSDAFVAKLDPTSSGVASLVYATPLGGTSPLGGNVVASATGVAANDSGTVYVTGTTTASDFPSAVTTSGVPNGFQPSCDSCQASSAGGDAFLAAISENAAQEPSVYFSPGNEKFPATTIGTPVVGQPIAILNAGEQNLTISDIEIVGQNASDFLPQIGACLNTPLSPGPSAQCSLEITFAPSVGGTETAFVSVWDNAPGSPQLFELTGTGSAPHASVTPSVVDFGSQPANTTGANPQTITVANVGTEALNVADESGPTTSSFRIQTSTCPLSMGTLAAGSSCTIQISFDPTSVGSFQDQISIQDNSDLQSAAVQTVSLKGVGTAPAPVVHIEPTTMILNFGTISVGKTSGPQMVSLSNQGSATLSLGGITIGGSNGSDFVIDTSVTTCPLAGGTVAISGQCSVGVQLAPQSAGTSKNASLVFSDNAGNSPQVVALTGAATDPASVQLSPSNLNFPDQGEGTASSAQTVTITNTGTSAGSVGTVSLTGANASDFSEQSSCSPVLSAGMACKVSISFQPAVGASPGPRAAALNVPGASPNSVALAGTATQSAISFTSSINFASQLVGTQGAPQPITITNSSSGAYAGALTFAGIAVNGTNQPDFTIAANTCATAGATLLPGAQCTVQVAFTPQEPATCGDNPSRSAMVRLQDSAPGSPQSISLSGEAADFCLVAANGQPAIAPVQAGQTAAFNWEVAPSGGFSGSVSLSCSTPSGDDLGPCSVSPSTVDVGPSAPAGFVVSVPTFAASGVPQAGPSLGTRRRDFGGVAFASLALLSLIGLLAGRIRHETARASCARAFRAIQWTTLLLTISVGVVACGSAGSSDPPSTPGTPSGTYTVTLTASTAVGGSTTSRTAALTFTVE